ncbi:peptidase domain-containing ABC transporter [Chitinophaga sp.]|uniref:peptidase domain-containing ABC transporter n=1 Tax=Chitinophaga sp. TaxID=1869181 RepID=UPI0031E2D028
MFKRRLKFQYQLESSDCGPACLAMVASYHQRPYSIRDIKEHCALTRMGVSVHDIISGARKMGFRVNGVQLTPDQLDTLPLPAILYWKQRHFVVLYNVQERNGNTYYYIADPSYGKSKMDAETLTKEWKGAHPKGVAILMEPDGDVVPDFLPGKKVRLLKEEFIQGITRFVVKHKWRYLISFLLLLAGLVANWCIPVVFRKMIDNGIGNRSLHLVWILLLAQLGLFLSNFVSGLITDLLFTKLNFKLSIQMKEHYLLKLMKLPTSYFDTRINAETLQRMADQGKIQQFITWKALNSFLNILNIVVFSIILFNINKYIFSIFFLLSILSILWVSLFLRLRKVMEYSLFLRQSENNNSQFEFIMHMPEIKINNAQYSMIAKLTSIQEKLHELELRSLFLNMYQGMGMNFITKFKELLAIGVCAYLIIRGQMTIGALLSISYILGQLGYPINILTSHLREAQDANIAQKRINEVYLEKNENDESRLPISAIPDKILLNNVSFKYPGSFNHLVLRNISFEIPRNKVTAIVGSSGSGKSTVLKLLLSYYQPTKGELKIGQQPLSTYDSDEWRKLCGTVLQDGHIFAGTIAENIAIAEKDIDRERIMHAARIACIHDFITELPMGYNTRVGSVGIPLSGGQRQRLLIARAIYKEPELLLFDEATSSLDANNEKQIMENLQEFFKGRTVVIIAHRLSTVKNADQIIVLNNGVIAEAGNHQSLVNARGNYFELVRNQLELGN